MNPVPLRSASTAASPPPRSRRTPHQISDSQLPLRDPETKGAHLLGKHGTKGNNMGKLKMGTSSRLALGNLGFRATNGAMGNFRWPVAVALLAMNQHSHVSKYQVFYGLRCSGHGLYRWKTGVVLNKYK